MEVAAAALPAGFDIPPGVAGVIASVCVLIGIVYQARRADKRAKSDETAEPVPEVAVPAAPVPPPNADMDFVRYVREEVASAVARETAALRAELDDLREHFGAVAGKLARTRQAFREFIRDVYELWPAGPVQPPHVPGHVRTLLLEDDLDGTLSRAEVRDRVATDRAVRESTTEPDNYG